MDRTSRSTIDTKEFGSYLKAATAEDAEDAEYLGWVLAD